MLSNPRVERAFRGVGLTAAVLLISAAIARAQTDGQSLSPLAVQVACAPTTSTDGPPEHPLQVIGGDDTAGRTLFSEPRFPFVAGGPDPGLQVGPAVFLRPPSGWTLASATGPPPPY